MSVLDSGTSGCISGEFSDFHRYFKPFKWSFRKPRKVSETLQEVSGYSRAVKGALGNLLFPLKGFREVSKTYQGSFRKILRGSMGVSREFQRVTKGVL